MPNPKLHQPPITNRFALCEGWRVVVHYVHGDGYTAQLEHESNGEWTPTGPKARSRQSEPVVLDRLAHGLRGMADLIEYGLALRPNLVIGEGCPECRYPHINFTEAPHDGRWRCVVCHAGGVVPSPALRRPKNQVHRVPRNKNLDE